MQYQMGDKVSEKKPFQIQIRYFLLPLLIAIIVYVGYLLFYVGAFKPVLISEKEAGPFFYLYKEHTGAYHKIVPVIETVETWAKEQKIPCTLSFGKYLNDPSSVDEERLRSIGGCLVSEEESKALAGHLPEGFKLEAQAPQKYVIAQFEGSPGIGPMKVYPKVFQYIEEQRLLREEWVLEIYEVHSQEAMTTTYHFPLKR
jgi:hypothetical protein